MLLAIGTPQAIIGIMIISIILFFSVYGMIKFFKKD